MSDGAPGETALGPGEAAALFGPCREASHLLVAISGGPDSVALAGLLARWAATTPGAPRLSLATVDHGLRPEGATEAAGVAAFAARLDLDHATLVWQGTKPARGIQEAAREARYRLLAVHARAIGASHLVTAHTRDDQAETVLMRLVAGSGLAGLAGMSPSRRRGELVHLRPLLGIAKARLVATCRAEGWPYAEDPSNADPRFARARLRRIMPLLAAEGLTAERLVRLAERQARANAALDDMAAAVLGEHETSPAGLRFARHRLAGAPREVLLRALGQAIRAAQEPAGQDIPPLRLERLEALAERLAAALVAGRPFKATLAGLVLALDRSGALTVRPEPPRRRNTVHPDRPTSLGKGAGEA